LSGGGEPQKAGMNIALTLGLVAGGFLLIRQFSKK